jgi:hypothetical protein
MDLNRLTSSVSSFIPTSLNEMEKISLMDRLDTKYVIPVNKLPDLLKRTNGQYKILEIDKARDFQYHNVYLDSPDYYFFNQHVTGKLNRHKVRFRKYVSTGTTFLEIKLRNNKNRTVKWRIESTLTEYNGLSYDAQMFIGGHVSLNSLEIEPVLVNCFRRLTLAGYESNERITVDYDLRFSDNNGSMARFPYLAIIEVKRDAKGGRSIISDILKSEHIYPSGFSKYCMGTATLKDLPHKNTLKSKFIKLNKIENEYFRNNNA